MKLRRNLYCRLMCRKLTKKKRKKERKSLSDCVCSKAGSGILRKKRTNGVKSRRICFECINQCVKQRIVREFEHYRTSWSFLIACAVSKTVFLFACGDKCARCVVFTRSHAHARTHARTHTHTGNFHETRIFRDSLEVLAKKSRSEHKMQSLVSFFSFLHNFHTFIHSSHDCAVKN